MACCTICKPTIDLQQQQPPTKPTTTKTSCPSLHGHQNFRPTANRNLTTNGTRGSCAHCHRRQIWTRASWEWWSATRLVLFYWLSTPFLPSETVCRAPVVWSSSPSWRPSSSSFPWFSSFFHDLYKHLPINIISHLL